MEVLPLVLLRSLEGCGARPPHPERARGSLGDGGDTLGVCLSGMGLFSLPWLPSRALQLPWERRIGVKKQHLEMAKKGRDLPQRGGLGPAGSWRGGILWVQQDLGDWGVPWPGDSHSRALLFPREVLLCQLSWDLGG